MSTQKKTAFARTPRGKSTGRKTDTITINREFLDRFTQARMAPDMSTVLTKTNSELTISIEANGRGNYNISTKSGEVIGDAADVQKVQSLGSFINDERKAIIKTSVSANAKKTVAAIVRASRDEAFGAIVPRAISRIDKSFVDVFRSVSAQAEMLNSNVQQLAEYVPTGVPNEMIKAHLMETAARIRYSIGRFLFYRAGVVEGEDALKLNHFLLEDKVISWVFNRLCSQKLQLGGKEFEFRRLYFPREPTKGLILTYKEFKNVDLRNNQGGILDGMATLSGLYADSCVRLLCGIPAEWNIETCENDAQVLANVPLLVPPFLHCVTVEEHFALLVQHGERGLPWNVGNLLDPQSVLKYMGTIPKRIAYGFIGAARFSAPKYQVMFPGFTFDPLSDKEHRSVFVQLQTAFRAASLDTGYWGWACTIPPTAQRSILASLVTSLMEVPASSNFGVEIKARLEPRPSIIRAGDRTELADIWSALMDDRNSMSDATCEMTLATILEANITSKKKTNKQDAVRSARSGISAAGTVLVAELRRRKYIALAARIDGWLRSFLSSALQGSVAEVIQARLEASLATPIEFGRSDTQVYYEPVDIPGGDDHQEEEEDQDEPEPGNPDDE